MENIEFYQMHLDRVSRSFAFCIKKLEAPLRGWVSLSYLMCRVLDTIEDSAWSDRVTRDQVYSEFGTYLARLPGEGDLLLWAQRFPPSIPEGEKKLLSDSFKLFRDLHALPDPVRLSVQQTVERMYQGMRHYARSQDQDPQGILRLKDLGDVNRYCYFVAGVVGELLSRLFLFYQPDFSPDPSFMKNSFHFGLFLQKVNLLKDQQGDEKEGRYLIPDRDLVFSSLRENAIGSIEYITSLPAGEKGYRIFCAWSLFLGAASLPFIERSYKSQDSSQKIPRSVTEQILASIAEIAQDNQALKEAFYEALNETFPVRSNLPVPEIFEPGSKLSEKDWFNQISGEVLTPSELAELRMVELKA